MKLTRTDTVILLIMFSVFFVVKYGLDLSSWKLGIFTIVWIGLAGFVGAKLHQKKEKQVKLPKSK